MDMSGTGHSADIERERARDTAAVEEECEDLGMKVLGEVFGGMRLRIGYEISCIFRVLVERYFFCGVRRGRVEEDTLAGSGYFGF